MLFNQTIQLIELTKELERIPVDTLTSTYALGHTYNGAGNWIKGLSTRNEKYGKLGSYFRYSEDSNYYKNIVQGSINIIGISAYYDDGSGNLPYEELPVTISVSVNGEQVYQIVVPSDANIEGKVVGAVDISNYVGSVEIKYYANRVYGSDNLWAQVVYTTQAIADIPNENKRSVTDVINRVLDVGVACRTLSEKPFYKLDPVYAEMFSKIPAPEYTFTRATLYEVLLEIGTTNNLGAIPSIRLHYSQTPLRQSTAL